MTFENIHIFHLLNNMSINNKHKYPILHLINKLNVQALSLVDLGVEGDFLVTTINLITKLIGRSGNL